MLFKDFFKNELKDNSSFLLTKEDNNSYSYSLYGKKKNEIINVEISRSRRSDIDFHDLLNKITCELKVKLLDKDFLKKNLYAEVIQIFDHTVIINDFQLIIGK